MSIKKAKANHHNGTDFDVLHYETQASQVKLLGSDGAIRTSIQEAIIDGKSIEGIDLNSVLDTGLYAIKNCLNSPLESITESFVMNVYAVKIVGIGSVVVQLVEDHIKQDSHKRYFDGTVFTPWQSAGSELIKKINKNKDSIGSTELLSTTAKGSLVEAVNEVVTNAKGSLNELNSLIERVSGIETVQGGHDHDDLYVRKTGGDYTGEVSVANNKSIAGKNTSGLNVNIGKIDALNKLIVGDAGYEAVLMAKGANLSVGDGTSKFKVYHSGNAGHGSGMDADTIDGVEGSKLAKVDDNNRFTVDQHISEGKSVILASSELSNQSGSIFFQTKAGVQTGRIRPNLDGGMKLYAGTVVGLDILASGDTETTHDHILNAKDRQVAVRFKLNDVDLGAGLYMNNTSKQLGMYDWEKKDWYFTTDRDDMLVNFRNALKIQGKKLSIQTTAPAAPSIGDVWIDI